MRKPALLFAAVALVALAMGVAGCSPAAAPVDTPAPAPVDQPSEGGIGTATIEDVEAALADDTAVVVDARNNNAFIGWPLDDVARGGHIEGATDFSADWLAVDRGDDEAQKAVEDRLVELLDIKGIKGASRVIVYDANGEDAKAVADYFAKNGIENIALFDVDEWAADSARPLTAYPNFDLIVPPSYVNERLADENTRIFEVSWGEEGEEYLASHIPGAVHINTDEVEVGPMWNRVSDAELEEFALNNGITVDTPVIVYTNDGASSMAAYRVHAILTYMGVKDVRTLNGGFPAWVAAGYETEERSVAKTPVDSFGGTVPANDYIIDMPVAKAILADPENASLVDIRTWEEHIGETPGYSDIDEAGRPEGARFGGDMPADGANVDSTMRNMAEVLDMWAEWGIEPEHKLGFFCGTGWRAAETLVYADVAGLEDIHLYDGGWYEWIMNGDNPQITGEPTKP